MVRLKVNDFRRLVRVQYVSIPHGTIKRIKQLKDKYRRVGVSIPHGTIKRLFRSEKGTPFTGFNSTWYD